MKKIQKQKKTKTQDKNMKYNIAHNMQVTQNAILQLNYLSINSEL